MIRDNIQVVSRGLVAICESRFCTLTTGESKWKDNKTKLTQNLYLVYTKRCAKKNA